MKLTDTQKNVLSQLSESKWINGYFLKNARRSTLNKLIKLGIIHRRHANKQTLNPKTYYDYKIIERGINNEKIR